jgi:DNA invertase Pin-like site-specific DNA recombinase
MKVGYARVSTGEQSDALTQQIARLEKSGVVQIFSDIKSGRKSDRKEFNKLLAAVKRGEVAEIVITRIDRLARSVVSMSKAIALLEECKVKLTILDAPIEDISNPFSKFSINQMSALAQFESDLLQNRVRHGFDYFREQNKASGKVPFGYRRENERYVPDDTLHPSGKTNWAIAGEIIDHIISNNSPIRGTTHWIQETYGITWSVTGFQNWLKNPTLRGHTRYNVRNLQHHPEKWDIRPDTHAALISPSKDAQLQFVMSENKRRWGANRDQGNRGTSLLSGQIFCGCCDGKCYVNRKGKDILICNKRSVYGKAYCSNKYGTPLPFVTLAVDAELCKRAIALRDFAFDEDIPDPPELAQLKNSLDNLLKMPSNEFIDDAIAGLRSRISQMQVKKDTPNLRLIDEWVQIFGDIQFFASLPHSERFQLYRRFVKRVFIANREIIKIELVEIF